MSNILVKCSVDSIAYRNDKIENPVINLNNVVKIIKGTHAWYPDNLGMASIEFHFDGRNENNFARWVFPVVTTQEAYYDNTARRNKIKDVLDFTQRDAEFDALIERFKG